jgi:hypothetical protein
MLSHEVLRAAANIVRAGWSEGGVAARDASGREVDLYARAIGGMSQSRINPAAVKFSAYGAICKVLSSPSAAGTPTGAIWTVTRDLSRAKSPVRPGGNNYLHPLVQFNADDERTAEDVIELLEAAAAQLEAVVAGRAT